MSTERIVQTNKVDICIQTFGDSTHPAILLIHGATASMLSWEDEFCQRLAMGERFVIRYDHRDTGQSVTYKPGQPPYSLNDLMEDAIGILSALNLSRAHIVGRSMGGSIAVLAALHHPNHVNSLTLMATSPGGPDLSPPADTFLAHMHSGQQPDWADREAVIEYIMALLTVFDGGTAHFDRRAIRAHVAREVDRATNIASSQLNHFVMDLGEPVRHRLKEIATPTLVIHGAHDPVFPLDHGQTIAAEIPNADILILPDSGHLVLAPSWDQVVPAILSHTRAAT